MRDLEKEISALHERNEKVEHDKAWETSAFRKLVVVILTYVVVLVFFIVAKLPHPFINSFVPSLAFILSQASLPIFRKIWEKLF